MLEEAGFTAIEIGPPVDTFVGTIGEDKARAFDVYGYAFLAHRP
jgi:methanogenic corrinoid protein MtbC1